jgi:hypothetical protein
VAACTLVTDDVVLIWLSLILLSRTKFQFGFIKTNFFFLLFFGF